MTAPIVLVHGAWHGGWCWSRVRSRLHARGRDVHSPTLAGLGERAGDLATAPVGLREHVDDVVDVLVGVGRPVVLVGHSYAGFVVREAADRRPDLVERLVMVEAWFGDDGVSMFGRAPDWFRSAMADVAVDGPHGALVPVPDPSLVGVTDEGDAAWLARRLTPQPLGTFTQPTTLTGAVDDLPTTAITAPPGLLPFAEWAGERGWPVTQLAGGHDLMVTSPGELAEALDTVATSG